MIENCDLWPTDEDKVGTGYVPTTYRIKQFPRKHHRLSHGTPMTQVSTSKDNWNEVNKEDITGSSWLYAPEKFQYDTFKNPFLQADITNCQDLMQQKVTCGKKTQELKEHNLNSEEEQSEETPSRIGTKYGILQETENGWIFHPKSE